MEGFPVSELFRKDTPHSTKLFSAIETILSQNPSASSTEVVCQALSILKDVEQDFIKQRSTAFFEFLLKKLSVPYPLSGKGCAIFSVNHVVTFPFHYKNVVGFLVQLDDIHADVELLIDLLCKHFPKVVPVKRSSYTTFQVQKRRTFFYFEVQHEGETFSPDEVEDLKEKLLHLGNALVKQAPAPIPSMESSAKTLRWLINEVEIGDLPHVLIDLDLHTPKKVFFLVYICQITGSIGKLAAQLAAHTNIEVTCQFNEKFKNAFREGLILKVELPHFPDASFVEKRFEVSKLLEKILGSFRDVNGGLLEHIEKNYCALAHTFSEVPNNLRPFFDSITPEDERATCPPALLKTLYLTAQNVEKELLIEEDSWVGAMIKTDDPALKKTLIESLPRARFALANAPSKAIFISYLHHPSTNEVSQFKALITDYLKEIKRKEDPTRVLRLCTTSRFTSFDPRTGTEEETSYLHKMLFEGLTRIDPTGKPEPAIAEKIDISPDGKCYTFHLRKSKWSNGLPLTAHDFLYSWQMILKRKDLAPLSYLFDSIQNAQEIKEGLLPLSEFGATTPDDHTLIVHLQSPCVPFLEICALSLFSPICQQVDEKEPNWPLSQGDDYVCNGPFTLESKDDAGELVLRKNPLYWENKRVNLHKVTIPFVSYEEGKRLFLKKEVDALVYYKRHLHSDDLKVVNASVLKGVVHKLFLCFNCQKPPFHNKKVRKALALAIDRKKIATVLANSVAPTTSFYCTPIYVDNKKQCDCIE
ncbi:MAG: peptide ABC transporter substrate-binding protein, partial [Chlamydiia bacterium]|nr:peptide ABC transporter substrate-binding protein [Chlamydiia bacterium]